MSSRVIDYFALLRCVSKPKFSSEVLLRFPEKDHPQCVFPNELHMFCFPTGEDLFRRPETISSEFSFLLTEIDGRRVFVSAIRFVDKGCNDQIYCIALSSHWPFYNQMMQFLRYLSEIASSTRTFPAPLESILTNLIFEVPLPPRGRTEVIVQLPASNITFLELSFKRPPPNAGCLVDYDFSSLFQYFSVDNILLVFSGIFSERRIVFVSSYETCLTPLIEAFNCIIFPFIWRHAYIPLLPSSLVDYICAPMPFLMGICRSYVPEKSALTGVLLVDCDFNTVTFVNEEGQESNSLPVPVLPDRAGRQLLKRLRTLTSLPETNFVCSPDFSADLGSVQDCFLRFFAMIFLNFHSHFDDSKESNFDKKGFLDSCSERCEFTNALLSSQMFASFLDERMQFSNDMDTLLFDEYIRREQGKPAAFLADTSQIHKSRYVCQSPITSGSITYASGFPSSWDCNLIPASRAVDTLVDIATEFQRATAAGMSYASLKFFMDQKTYSRKLHLMSQRCSRDEQTFVSIVKGINEWTQLQRSSLATENRLKIHKVNPADDATIGDIWNQVFTYIETIQNSKHSAMKMMDSMNNSLADQIHFIDRETKILFDESRQLDAEATMRKAELERIKLLLVNARQKLAFIEEEARMPMELRKAMSLFKQSDLSRLVAARSEVQALSIEQSEAETAFWTHLDLYNSRIPQIITELERLSSCRLASLKMALKLLTFSRQEQLRQETAALQTLSDVVNEIDIDETSFQDNFPSPSSPSFQGVTDSSRGFTPSPVATPSMKAITDIHEPPQLNLTSSANAQSTPKIISQHIFHLFRYSILLWGQFEIAFQHAVEGKAVVKQFSIVVDSAGNIFESVSRSLGKVSKASLAPRSVSVSFSSKLQSSSVRYVARLSEPENALSDQFDVFCHCASQQYSHTSRKLQQLFVEIRVLKRECKSSFTMIQRRKAKLESEIQVAHDSYQKSGGTGLPNTNLNPKSQREIDMISRQWETAQVQHQLGNAHLLDQFQRIEELRLSSLKRIMSDLHGTLAEHCAQLKELLRALLSVIHDTSIVSVISECSQRFSNDDSNKELFGHIGDGIDFTSSLISTMESLLSVDEAQSSKLRKTGWNIRIQEEMPSVSKALTSVSSFFQLWPQIIDRNVNIRRDDLSELRRWRDQWLSKLTLAINKEQAEKKNRDNALSAYERARFDVAKAMQAVTQNQERLAKAESESSQLDTGMSIMKFMKTPIDKQRTRLSESQAELEAAQSQCNHLELERNIAEQKHQSSLSSMHSFALELEEARLSGMLSCLKKTVEHLLEGNKNFADALDVLGAAVCQVDVNSDMTKWVNVVRSKASLECPEIVLRNLERDTEVAELRISPDHTDSVSVEAQSAVTSRSLAAVELSPTENPSTGVLNRFSERKTEYDDCSISEGQSRYESSLGCIEVEGPKDSDSILASQHSQPLQSGLKSEISSINTSSD